MDLDIMMKAVDDEEEEEEKLPPIPSGWLCTVDELVASRCKDGFSVCVSGRYVELIWVGCAGFHELCVTLRAFCCLS
mgnify:CR=1 FL=1